MLHLLLFVFVLLRIRRRKLFITHYELQLLKLVKFVNDFLWLDDWDLVVLLPRPNIILPRINFVKQTLIIDREAIGVHPRFTGNFFTAARIDLVEFFYLVITIN